jgi:aminoglycoside phosphotransferase (APT) family kinase protein
MLTPWATEIDITRDLVTGSLEADFPGLHIHNLASLGEGWNSCAYLVNDEWVFRFPKRRDVEKDLHKEMKLLPQLDGILPIQVPRFTHTSLSRANFPFIYSGYRKMSGRFSSDMEGVPLHHDRIAQSLAVILSRLHCVSLPEARSWGCEEKTSSVEDGARIQVMEEFTNLPDWPEKSRFGLRMVNYLRSIDNISLGSPDRITLTHGDPLPDHILIGEDLASVCAMIDWGAAHLGDPAIDFAGLYYWRGAPFVDQVFRHYTGVLDSEILNRARFIALGVGIGDVRYGLEEDRPLYFNLGRTCLENCL